MNTDVYVMASDKEGILSAVQSNHLFAFLRERNPAEAGEMIYRAVIRKDRTGRNWHISRKRF